VNRTFSIALGGAALLVTASLFVLSRRWDLLSLPSTALIAKLPKPPDSSGDCYQVRRDLQSPSQSASSVRGRSVRITAPLSTDQVEIYRAVIRAWMSVGKEPLNVSDETFPIRVEPLLSESGCGCLAGMRSEELLKSSHSFRFLTSNILVKGAVTFLSRSQQSGQVLENDPHATMRKGLSAKDAVDNAFRNGLFSLSEILFDPDGQHAIVSYSFVCGGLCGNGGTWLFEKTGRGWTKTNLQCGGGWVS
jgi:hypothetical protein